MLRIFSVRTFSNEKEFRNGFKLGDSYKHYRLLMFDRRRDSCRMISDHEYHKKREEGFFRFDDIAISAPLTKEVAQEIVRWNRDPKNQNVDEDDEHDYVFGEGLWE